MGEKKLLTEEQEAEGEGGQAQARWQPEDHAGGACSLRRLVGQLLLVEAHDMVHKLVLLISLDHAAPTQQRACG